jgi:cytochrome c biogenesis protein
MRTATLKQAFELAGSMRFAISLLTLIAIASVAGTVLKQNEPYNNYLNQFGAFWFGAFDALSLYAVYSAWWFLAILAFLVLSTSLCVWRNAPRMLAEMRRFKENLREQAFAAFPHRAELPAPAAGAAARVETTLREAGFALRARAVGDGVLIAAKAGSANRLGYIFTHVGIIVICVGGLLDGDLLLRAQLALGDKQIVRGNPLIAEVPPQSRLPASNPSFRGNVLIPEGDQRDFAVLAHRDGILLQELPFTIALKKFVIEHFSSGAPKLFASEVEVTDRDTGRSFAARIEVNRPLIHRGIAVYQSSFDDGGTRVTLSGFPLVGARDYRFAIEGEIGRNTSLAPESAPEKSLTLELVAFRPFNVERVARREERATLDGARGIAERVKESLGPGAAPGREKEMRNVGPTVGYKLRDAAGQAREYQNYMLPMDVDGRWFLLSGMRETPSESFRYLRIPLDAEGGLDEFMRLRAALSDRAVQGQAGERLARDLAPAGGDARLKAQLVESGRRSLETFGVRGYQAVADFIERGVPEAEREKAAEVFLRILNGAAWHAWQIARERQGLAPAPADERSTRFVQDALNAVSDAHFYGAPVYLHLNAYDEVKASVFQLTRSPGKNIVYLGCLSLVVGLFAMFYIRERRAWVLLKPDRVLAAMSGTRRGVDFEREFDELVRRLRAAVSATS